MIQNLKNRYFILKKEYKILSNYLKPKIKLVNNFMNKNKKF